MITLGFGVAETVPTAPCRVQCGFCESKKNGRDPEGRVREIADVRPDQPVFFRPPEMPLMVSSTTPRVASSSAFESLPARRRRIISTWM